MNYAAVESGRRAHAWDEKMLAQKWAVDQSQYRWLPMPFGKHEGLTLPQLILAGIAQATRYRGRVRGIRVLR